MPSSLVRIPMFALILGVGGLGAHSWAHHATSGSPSSLSELREAALYGDELEAQGEAILALVAHHNGDAVGVLRDIEAHRRAPELVRTWAAAGAVQRAQGLDELGELADMLGDHPALERPIRLAALGMMDGRVNVQALLELSVASPALSSAFSLSIADADPGQLGAVMLAHEDDKVRRLAAGHLAGMDDAGAVVRLYRFDPDARTVPWKGGALYVPASGWGRSEARKLTGSLIAWNLFCDRKGLDQEKRQIYNNLRSVGLWRQAGMRNTPSQDTVSLLGQWAQVVGVEAVAQMLRDQGVRHDPSYAAALEGRSGR
jgi:hypothetical protein